MITKRNLKELNLETGPIANFVRNQRKELGYTQLEFSRRIGVGLRFLKELEQGKETLRIDKINQVLNYLGYELQARPKSKELPFPQQDNKNDA